MTKKRRGQAGFYEDLVEQVQGYRGEKKEIVRLAPELFKLMTNLMRDNRLPKEAKPLINGAISYFVAPYDGIPEEAFGPIGFMDDIFVCLHVLRKLMKIVDTRLLDDNWESAESVKTFVERVYPDVEEYMRHAAKHILNYVDSVIGIET